MQNTSALYRSILAQTNHWFETKIRLNGVDYGENKLFSVSTRAGIFSGNPEVGKAVSAEIDVSMVAPTETIPPMAKIEAFVRVCGNIPVSDDATIINGYVTFGPTITISDGYVDLGDTFVLRDGIAYAESGYEYGESEWIPQGVFYIDTREASHNDDGLDVLNIHGYDAMLFTEQDYPGSDRVWPLTDIEVVQDIASKIGVTVDPRTVAAMTDGNTIPLPTGFTMRELLGYIASMYVGSFVISDAGKLRLVSLLELPEETNYLIDASGSAITFGGVRILV